MRTSCRLIFSIVILLVSVPGVFAQSLNELYPADKNIESDPDVLFYDNFENGWQKWHYPSSDTAYLFIENIRDTAHTGNGYLRSTVTESDLLSNKHISSKTRHIFEKPADKVYWRFYTRFNTDSPAPHHWVKLAATNGIFDVRGKAGIKPGGNEAMWLDIDINNNDLFSFYVYWHDMHSGRCNDGSTKPGCEGDQGDTYFYGNSFKPADQTPMPRDEWFCIEIYAKLNDIDKDNGELSLWINDELVGHYKKGTPTGTWLRNRFHSDGCKFDSCGKPEAFDGFNFRTDENVKFREIYMDAYYQLDSFNRKKNTRENSGKKVSADQTIYYDDVVVATERIGCMANTR